MTTAETTAVAVWLHYLAGPGTLLTTQAPLAFLPATIPWVEQEMVRLPGQAEPLMAYRLGSLECPSACSWRRLGTAWRTAGAVGPPAHGGRTATMG